MKLFLESIILFVNDVDKLKSFYIKSLGLELTEEIKSEWALLKAGNCNIGLHKVGKEYEVAPGEEFKVDTNTKLVFEIEEDIFIVRERLVKDGVTLHDIKTFDNYNFWLCDGEDPEGNIFQLKRKK